MIAPKIGIHSSDLRVLLRERDGLTVQPWQLRHAIEVGHIPAPYLTASGDYAWPLADVKRIAGYFKAPRRQGRPRKNPAA